MLIDAGIITLSDSTGRIQNFPDALRNFLTPVTRVMITIDVVPYEYHNSGDNK